MGALSFVSFVWAVIAFAGFVGISPAPICKCVVCVVQVWFVPCVWFVCFLARVLSLCVGIFVRCVVRLPVSLALMLLLMLICKVVSPVQVLFICKLVCVSFFLFSVPVSVFLSHSVRRHAASLRERVGL